MSNTNTTQERFCSYCSTREHETRLVGNFTVELIEINVDGATKYACQACRFKVKEVRSLLVKAKISDK